VAVHVGNGNNTGVVTWTFSMLAVPVGSALPIGVQQTGATPTWSFTPDVTGCYRVQVTVADNATPTPNTNTDVRVFGIAEPSGRLIPGFGASASDMNFGGSNTQGWAPAVDAFLKRVDEMPEGSSLANVAALRAAAAASGPYNLSALNTPNDGGGGSFTWQSGSTAADDGAITILPTGHVGAGRFVRDAATGYTVNAAWFGGIPTARYQNPADYKWYADSLYTVLGSDGAPSIRAAIAYLNALGGGSLYIPSGNWLVSSFTPGAADNEIFKLGNNITIFGDGDASAIRIQGNIVAHSAGVATTGYACIFGAYSATGSIPYNNVTIRKLMADHNSLGNTWGAPNFGGLGSGDARTITATTLISAGTNVTVEFVSTVNQTGSFIHALGTYGAPQLLNNARVRNCRLFNLATDAANVPDCSWIAIGATKIQVQNNDIDANGFQGSTAIETHGVIVNVQGNMIDGPSVGISGGGDSANADTIVIAGNIMRNVQKGVIGFSIFGKTVKQLVIENNTIRIRQGTLAGQGEAGIQLGFGNGVGVAFGGGFWDVKINANQVIYGGTPTSGYSYGMSLLGNFGSATPNTGGGLRITNNKVYGFGTTGIYVATQMAANAGNVCADMTITNNEINNGGVYGIAINGLGGESGTVWYRFLIDDNKITDDRGGGSILQYGVQCSGLAIDANCTIGSNPTIGATLGELSFNTSAYPLLRLRYLDKTMRQVTSEWDGITNSFVPGFVGTNTVLATVGTPDEYPPGDLRQGYHWASSQSQLMEFAWEYQTDSGNFNWRRLVRANFNNVGGSYVQVDAYTYFPGSPGVIDWSFSAPIIFDATGAAGSIEHRYQPGSGSGDYYQITENGGVAAKWHNQTVTMFAGGGLALGLSGASSDYLGFGASFATTGYVRMGGGSSVGIAQRNSANSGNLIHLQIDGADNVYFGHQENGTVLFLRGGVNSGYVQIDSGNTANVMRLTGTAVSINQPLALTNQTAIAGTAGASAGYGYLSYNGTTYKVQLLNL